MVGPDVQTNPVAQIRLRFGFPETLSEFHPLIWARMAIMSNLRQIQDTSKVDGQFSRIPGGEGRGLGVPPPGALPNSRKEPHPPQEYGRIDYFALQIWNIENAFEKN